MLSPRAVRDPNIHPVGWVTVNGSEYNELVRKCAFVILPSCSEGQSGSVVQCMYSGLFLCLVPEEAGSISGAGKSRLFGNGEPHSEVLPKRAAPYSRTEYCLQFLRELDAETTKAGLQTVERYHMYWHGTFSSKQAFAVKSFLATQDLNNSELWLWLDSENGYAGY